MREIINVIRLSVEPVDFFGVPRQVLSISPVFKA